MEWHDGSVKNVHVDPVILGSYQQNLKDALNAYRKRMDWLSDESTSRKAFGTIVEKRYYLH